MTSPFLRFLPFAFLLTASCQAFLPENKAAQTDVAIFLEEVKKAPLNLGMEKTVSSEGKQEQETIKKPNLEHELSFFSKAILSEVYLKGYYTRTTREDNGVAITSFKANGEKPEVRLLEVIRNAQGQIVGLHLESEQDNYLYKSVLTATMFTRGFGSKQLQDYRIEGEQKMLFGNPYQFEIYARAL